LVSLIGRTVSHYKILEQLGAGGMGVVYKALDVKLDRLVALKFLTPDLTRDPQAKERFMNEARAASSFDHPNICTVYEIGEAEDGQWFIAMACYGGETLKERIDRGPLTIEEATKIALQIVRGLSRAHQKGLIHRDVKPANIIVTDEGVAKILDFGLSKLRGQTVITAVGSTLGTVAYMSPEQAGGDPVDHRSDIWSVGVVLYEMLIGQRPFKGEYDQVVFYSILNQTPPAIAGLRHEVPPDLQAIVTKCLQKDPAKRYQTAAELEADLELVQGATGSRQRSPATVVRPRHLPLKYAVLGLVLLLILFAVPPIRISIERLAGYSSSPAENIIAVLPFTSIGSDATDQVYCDGFTEIVTLGLMQLRPQAGAVMSVIPSSEIRGDTIKTAEGARQRLGASLVITGIVERDTDHVRIIINLIDAQHLRQLNSRSIDARRLTRISLQDSTVALLVAMLNVPVDPASLRMASLGAAAGSGANDFYTLGRGYLADLHRKGNIDFAIQQFEKAVKEDSTYALAYAGLGEAYWRKYELTRDLQWTGKATGYCFRAVELNSQLPRVRMTLALIYAGTGKYEDAVSEYQAILAKDTSNADAERGLAGTYKSWQKYDEAERAYKKAIMVRPSYWGGHLDLGSYYYFRKRYAEAIEEYKRVVDLTPDNAGGYSGLGAAYYALERYGEAEEAFKRSISIEPTYRLYSNLATLYFERKRFSDAIPVYEKALAINDRDYRVWANLASAFFWSGRRDSANAEFARSIKLAEDQRAINPKDATVLSDLADYNSMVGNKAEALGLIKESLALAPGDVEVIGKAVDVYEKIGERAEAISWMREGLKKGITKDEFEDDPELKELRADKRYQELVQR
jgi:serine/threonine protein kinase/tetratricopeptide (TPR) repeat protein